MERSLPMNAKILSLVLCAAFAFLLHLFPSRTQAQDRDPEALKNAQVEFQKQRYPTALNSFRAYLRNFPDDQDAWVWLGASYYHTGQASLALTTLSKAKPKGELKSLRRYYIALSHDALGNSDRAKTLLQKQAKSKDLLAEDALFELAVIQFESGEQEEAKKSLDEYKKRFDDGRFQKQIELIEKNLSSAGRVEVPGSRRSQYKASYFDTNPLSLVSMPHLWFYELGYNYAR
ncbi:MAG: tetratricopeptide repeat protein, partial [Bdellovibrionota bacterium]